jgi:ATP-dependent RNA helicase RhlE
LIATPGRLLDLLEKSPSLLREIRSAVLDEFDRLMDLGFEPQIAALISRLPARRQTLLLSATGCEPPERLALGPLRREEVTAGKAAPLAERFYFLKSNRKKGDLLLAALRETKGRAIVFAANREKANHLNGLLRLRGFASQALHGDRLQRRRSKAYQDFREGRIRVLVATDLASRGLDIPEVDLIVNYDLPRGFKEYVHRSGRTARRFRPGACLSFAGPDDYLALTNLEKGFTGPLPTHPDYARRDRWHERAERLHRLKIRGEKRKAFIRKEQGLDVENPDPP